MNRLTSGATSALPAPLTGLGVWAWAVTGGIALVLLVLDITIVPVLYEAVFPAALIGALLQCGSIVLGLIRPRIAAAVHVVGAVVLGIVAANAPWPWPAPVMSILALAAMLLVLVAAAPWWVSVTTWIVACTALTIVGTQSGAPHEAAIANLVVMASVTFAVLAIGLLMLLWWRASADLGEARAGLEQEHSAREWAEERSRVAREMHDVVAHSMSLVHMRATSARYRIPDLPDAAIAELDGIAAQAREALGEMRGVLGVLRGDDAAQLAPQPGLDRLQELVDGARAADIDLEARIDAIDPLPPETVQLALYRVAQEAIANIVRHAPGATATLRLEGGERIRLTITSRGGSAGASPDRGGTGIRGMIDRMTAIHGSLAAGPIEGGFEVMAVAPRAVA